MLKSKMPADILASVVDEWLIREGCGRTVIERSLSSAWHLPDITWTGSLVAQHSTRSGRQRGLKRTCLVMDSTLKKLQQAVADAMAGLSNADLRSHLPGKWCAAE